MGAVPEVVREAGVLAYAVSPEAIPSAVNGYLDAKRWRKGRATVLDCELKQPSLIRCESKGWGELSRIC
jgi:hypothetical protein